MPVKVKVKLSGRHAEDYLGQLPTNVRPKVEMEPDEDDKPRKPAMPSKRKRNPRGAY